MTSKISDAANQKWEGENFGRKVKFEIILSRVY